MRAKKYFFRLISITVIVLIAFVVTNYFIDIYGLFRDTTNRKIEVYADERISKYLLSFNYIPSNFNGILVGPSLSDNLNTQKISSYKIYNASMMGANISDLKPLILNTINNGNIRVLVICLDPYITKDYGKKSSVIDKKQYYSALGSVSLMKAYLFKFIRENQLYPDKFRETYITSYGYYDFDKKFAVESPKKRILEMTRQMQQDEIHINEKAFEELGYILNFARSNNVQIIGYFSPLPFPIFEINDENYYAYQNKITTLFTNDDLLIDLNDEQFKHITSDYSTFIDHGHLSKKGQEFVLNQLDHNLSKL